MEFSAKERRNAEGVAGQVRAILADFLDRMPLQFDRVLFLDRVERLTALIALWGTRVNLTAVPGDAREIGFHVLDSLAPIIFSDNDQSPKQAFDQGQVLDLGSGAGFPGLVLASAAPASFTLLESRRKRATFLAVAAAEMGLQNVTVEQRLPILSQPRCTLGLKQQRARSLAVIPPPDQGEIRRGGWPGVTIERGGAFDAVTAKAFAAAPLFHSAAASALKLGGIAILYANPGQDLALGLAEKDGLYEFRKIAYAVPRNRNLVQRILGLWRRG